MTISQEYISLFNKEYRKIFFPTQEEIDNHSVYYAYCCANFHLLLVTLPVHDYLSSFRKVLLNQLYAKYERTNLDVVDKINISDFNQLPVGGLILCGFHFSAYQIISTLLIKSNRKYFIVVNNSVVNSKEVIESNAVCFHLAKSRYSNTSQKNIIHLYTDQMGFMLSAKELLMDGYTMLVFAEGNSGLDGIMKISNKNLLKIPFLGRDILVRRGIPILSYITCVPIVPIFSLRYYENNEIKVITHEPIFPDFNVSRDQYCLNTLKILYGILERYVINDPFSWEGWLYVNKWLVVHSNATSAVSAVGNENNLIFNAKKYEKFRIDNNFFLLDKDSLLSYQIDYMLYEILNEGFQKDEVTPDDLQELRRMKIII